MLIVALASHGDLLSHTRKLKIVCISFSADPKKVSLYRYNAKTKPNWLVIFMQAPKLNKETNKKK